MLDLKPPKLFLDCQHKNHYTVSNAWIWAKQKMQDAASVTHTMMCRNSRLGTLTTWTVLGGGASGGKAVQLDYNRLAERTKPHANVCRIYRQPLVMSQLYCECILDWLSVTKQDSAVSFPLGLWEHSRLWNTQGGWRGTRTLSLCCVCVCVGVFKQIWQRQCHLRVEVQTERSGHHVMQSCDNT